MNELSEQRPMPWTTTTYTVQLVEVLNGYNVREGFKTRCSCGNVRKLPCMPLERLKAEWTRNPSQFYPDCNHLLRLSV